MDGDVVIMDLSGDLVASSAESLKAQVVKLSEKKFKYILAEMSKVGFMDSSGLGACMAIHKMLNEKSGLVVWAKPSETVGKVYRLTRADKKLTIAASRQEGLKALQDAIIAGRAG
jgi:anti-sigma B factor antagonist